MKYLNITLSLAVIVFTSCSKMNCEKKCDLNNSIETTDATYMDPYTTQSNVQVNILEDLVEGVDCNCIVSGWVKYRENGITVALVDYGDGQCDGWVSITICDDGDCESKDTKCYKYKQDCGVK